MKTSCPICQQGSLYTVVENPQDREYFKKRLQEATFLQCNSCHSVIQSPLPTHSEVSNFYDNDYQNYNTSPSRLIRFLFDKLSRKSAEDFLSKYGENSYVLDYGCGFGNFLISLRNMGAKQLYGFDYIPHDPIDGIHFFTSLDDIKKSGLRFDVIRMNHVIEHLVDLDETMIALSDLLKPDGKIIGQTPNPDSFTFNLFKSFWGALHFPYHTFLFSPSGLKKASGRWNTSLIQVEGALLPTGWAMSLENIIKPYLDGHKRGRSRIYPIIILATLPLTFIEYVLSKIGVNTSIFNFKLQRRN